MKRTKEELIKLRNDYLPYEEAEQVQKELIAIYKKEYIPKHTKSEYYDLIHDWDVDAVEERHEQDNYLPDKVYECFSCVSQHVYGFTKEHCYDQIWDEVEAKKKRIKEYKLLPTLKELVESDIIITPDEIYYTKEERSDEDSCDGHSGDIILRMREIGMDAYHKECIEKEWSFITKGMTEEDLVILRKNLQKYLVV